MEWDKTLSGVSLEAKSENGTHYSISDTENNGEITGYYPVASWFGETVDTVEEAQAAAEAHAQGDGWRPIDTAPIGECVDIGRWFMHPHEQADCWTIESRCFEVEDDRIKAISEGWQYYSPSRPVPLPSPSQEQDND